MAARSPWGTAPVGRGLLDAPFLVVPPLPKIDTFSLLYYNTKRTGTTAGPVHLPQAEAWHRNKIPRTGSGCGNTRDPCFGCTPTLHNRNTGVQRLFEYSTFPVLSQGGSAENAMVRAACYTRAALGGAILQRGVLFCPGSEVLAAVRFGAAAGQKNTSEPGTKQKGGGAHGRWT